MEQKRKDPKEKKCAICGKDMYAGEDWAYKRKIGGERTKWFCSYKCMRAYDAKTEPKQKKPAQAETEAQAPKEPVSRAVLAKVLKPLKDLPKGPPAKTGRPRKYPAKVEKVDKVPEVEPVQCIAHVAPADIEEAEQAVADLILQGGVNYQPMVDEAVKAEEPKKPGFRYEIKTIETSIGEFSYDRKAHLLIFRRKDEKNEFGYQYLSMSTAEWDKLLIIVPQLADLMGVTL